MRSKSLFIATLLLAACSPIRGCVESQFTLDADSRMPKWLAIPTTHSRDTITVQLSYYVPLFPVDNTVIELLDRNGRVLSTITGQHCWHPVMEHKKNQYGGLIPGSEPHYIYIQANGVLEVVEHERGPIFRITDNAALVKQAAEAKECNTG